jgi:hypothetical protein
VPQCHPRRIVAPLLGARHPLNLAAQLSHSCLVLEGIKQMLGRWFGGEKRDDADGEATAATQPPSPAEEGAGIRHGQAPANYVPPVDEGRPPH